MTISRRQLLAGSAVAASALNQPLSFAAQPKTKTYTMKQLFHGVCYYPELWPEQDVDRDIVEMHKLGINVVRIAEFAWSTMEPEEGKINLDFFRRVMDKMHAANIDVILCTPTATPPIWLMHNHPERAHKNADGVIMSHGARQHASYEHPAVLEACFKIIRAMAQKLGAHPALIAWQLDNEMKAHVAEDFSKFAIINWHKWLKTRFGSIDKLNQAWGTHLWSQYYQRFEQVPAPVKTPFAHNASLSTAYRMFCRESVSQFMKAQSDIIKMYSQQPITHNDNPAFNINHELSMEAQDFASYDIYAAPEAWGAFVFRSDLYRAAIPGRPFWVMETSTAHNGWLRQHHPVHPKGYLAAEAALVYGLGGEGFSYWLWRQQRTGLEIPHSAVMSAWFKPGIGHSEVMEVAKLKKALEPHLLSSALTVPEIAITYSDHARAMIETEPTDRREGFPTRYRGVIEHWHASVRDLGYHREVRFEGAALDGLKLLLSPAMPYVSEAFAKPVLDFIEQGGVWIAGPTTGHRDGEHAVHTERGLGLLEKMAGVTTEFYVPLTDTDTRGSAYGMEVPLSGWCAAMTPEAGTRGIGKISHGVAQGKYFICERKLGKGYLVLLGAQPHGENGKQLVDQLITHYASLAKVEQRFAVSQGSIVCPRVTKSGDRLWLVVNMDGKGGWLKLPGKARDTITQQALRGRLKLAPYEWRLINL